jgi:hypothetical protein
MTYASEHMLDLKSLSDETRLINALLCPRSTLRSDPKISSKRFTLPHLFAERSTEARLAACFLWAML